MGCVATNGLQHIATIDIFAAARRRPDLLAHVDDEAFEKRRLGVVHLQRGDYLAQWDLLRKWDCNVSGIRYVSGIDSLRTIS